MSIVRIVRINSRLVRACAASILLTVACPLSSCEFGANAVDGAAIVATEGTIFEYDDLGGFTFRPVQTPGPMQIKLLSKMATIGGRDSVLGFESSIDGDLSFSDVRGGELAVYFQVNREFETPVGRKGAWVRIPAPGDPEIEITVNDSIFQFSREFTSFRSRKMRIVPISRERFYVDGYYFDARTIKVFSTYQFDPFDEFGQAGSDEQELTYIEQLGVLAERKIHDDFGFESTHIAMTDIRIRR